MKLSLTHQKLKRERELIIHISNPTTNEFLASLSGTLFMLYITCFFNEVYLSTLFFIPLNLFLTI